MTPVNASPMLEILLVTVEQAAEVLSLSRSSTYELVLSGELPSIKIRKSRRIAVTALRAYVAQKCAEQTKEAA
jgi:excisionase family DNA binding protein